jgi:hypothetical protein
LVDIEQMAPLINTYGYTPYHDLYTAQRCSEMSGRKLLILFTGSTYSSDPDKVWKFLNDKEIEQTIEDYFVFVVLYTDQRQIISDTSKKSLNGQTITTVGGQHADIQTRTFNSNIQPEFIITDHMLKKRTNKMSNPSDKQAFLDFLETGIE